jgi:arylsulfatase A-like enzyme
MGGQQVQRLANYDLFRSRANDLLESRALREALDADQEPPASRARYGAHRFGQGCLLARRLIEAGVALVTVYWHYEGPDDSPVWDSHWNHFKHLRERLAPPADKAIAALVNELHQRGLLEDTLLVCLGEFGRTPKINNMAGRDHWPHVQSIMLAGAGVPVGTVLGASDRDGAYPVDLPVSPADLTATLLHLLGVPPELELADLQNRAVRASDGSVIAALAG